MAGDINRVTLVGRLTRDPELRHLPSGSPVLEFGLAVNGRQQDSGGQWVDKPNFFDVKVYGNQAEFLSQYLQKGRRVGIDGRLDWRSWDASLATRSSSTYPREQPFSSSASPSTAASRTRVASGSTSRTSST